MKFNALVLENILARQESLKETVIEHYKQDALTQLHKVLGSADFLGNPVGLVSTLGSGVTDLFYEPYQGFVSDRPQDIGIGFARGGISLVRKTVVGFSGTFSKFTGSLAKGLSAATMDKSFQHKRRIDKAKNKPRHALAGASTGFKQLYTGVASGITGVFDKPMEGARESGIGGFFQGVGVGLVGAFTKPLVGFIDMTSTFTEGIKGSAEENQGSVSQVRLPMVVPFDGRIRSYDSREAFGQSILATAIGSSQIGVDFYVAHVEIPGERSIVILSKKKLISATTDSASIQWKEHLCEIVDLSTHLNNIVLHIVSGSQKATRFRVIPLSDQDTQKVISSPLRSSLIISGSWTYSKMSWPHSSNSVSTLHSRISIIFFDIM